MIGLLDVTFCAGSQNNYTFCCSLTAKGHSFKLKSIVIRANRHTISRTEFQECGGTFITEFSIEFDNHEYVC